LLYGVLITWKYPVAFFWLFLTKFNGISEHQQPLTQLYLLASSIDDQTLELLLKLGKVLVEDHFIFNLYLQEISTSPKQICINQQV
jgi:hypothetical protein